MTSKKLSTELMFWRLFLATLLSGVLLSGCLAEVDPSASTSRQLTLEYNTGREAARISVFLNLKKSLGPAVKMKLAAVEIEADGFSTPLLREALILDAGKIGPNQIFIARDIVPAAKYNRLRFIFEGQELDLPNPVVEVNLPSRLELRNGDSKSIFITWDVEASINDSGSLIPVMSASRQSPPLMADLVYVACPEINTVYIIRSDRNWVYGSLGVSGKPTYLGVNNSTKELYVLSAKDSLINIVDMPTNRITRKIKVPMIMEAGFMTLSSDGMYAFILDEKDNYVLRMVLNSGSLSGRVRLGYQPKYATYLSSYQRLAVSSTLSGEVFILDGETLDTLDTISVGSSPMGLAAWDNLLYIAESDNSSLAVYDLYKREMRNRIRVGRNPLRVFQADRRLYIANYGSGSVSTLISGQLSVAKDIKTGGRPLEMGYDSNRNWIFIGNKSKGAITVVDSTTDQVYSEIDLGAAPLGIAVVQ